MRQAKCIHCKVRYIWIREVSMKKLIELQLDRCPVCGNRIQITSILYRGKVLVHPNIFLSRGLDFIEIGARLGEFVK